MTELKWYGPQVTQGIHTKLDSGMQNLADAIAARAKELAPVDTGALRDSIEVKKDGEDFTVGSDLEYALFVEIGTESTSPQPYLRPAVEEVEASKYFKD